MHTFEVEVFDPVNIDEVAFTPETNFRNCVCKRVDTEVDGFSWDSVINLKVEIVQGNSSVRIKGSVDSEAEDIFHRLIRGSDFELPE